MDQTIQPRRTLVDERARLEVADVAGFVEVNPVCAGLGDDLLHIVSDAVEMLNGERCGIAWGEHQYGNIVDGACIVHLSDRIRYCFDMAAHAAVIAGARPVGGDDGPNFPGHLADLFRYSSQHEAATNSGDAGQLA